MSKNKDYKKLIHTVRWLRLRKEVLSGHPLCQMCEKEGRMSVATEVHHIVPCETAVNARDMESLMYDRHNLVALCHRCHVEVHMALGKGGRQSRRERADTRLQDFKEKFLDGG